MSNVKLTSLKKHYAGIPILHDIDLDIVPGEFVVIVGPSGCGKSTLLKSIAGLEEVSAGSIEIAGRDVTSEEPGDRGIAMVFQSYALYPHMTVRENMGFGLRVMKRPAAEIATAVDRAAKILRIEELLDQKPAQLSGGQRQRVAIGRAITRQPHVFLFDEPLSNLDAALRTQMRVELATLHETLSATMIYVTHDQIEAMTMADRIVVLRAGRIEQVGAPLELYHKPVNQFVAAFLGAPRMNFFEGRVRETASTSPVVDVPGLPPMAFSNLAPDHGLANGDTVTVGVRPEAMVLQSGLPDGPDPVHDTNMVQTGGIARMTEQLGREAVLYVDAGDLRTRGSDTGTDNVTLLHAGSAVLTAGSPVKFGFKLADAYLFSPNGRTISL